MWLTAFIYTLLLIVSAHFPSPFLSPPIHSLSAMAEAKRMRKSPWDELDRWEEDDAMIAAAEAAEKQAECQAAADDDLPSGPRRGVFSPLRRTASEEELVAWANTIDTSSASSMDTSPRRPNVALPATSTPESTCSLRSHQSASAGSPLVPTVVPSDDEEEEQSPSADTAEHNEPAPVQLCFEQQKALDDILDADGLYLVFGKPGTGKSAVMEQLIEHQRRKPLPATGDALVVIAAPTAQAALRLCPKKGHTLYKLLGIRPGYRNTDMSAKRLLKYHPSLFVDGAPAVLILTEAFMIDRALWYYLEEVLSRAAKLKKNPKRMQKPFGGVWIVLDGDPLQIPPVSKGRKDAPFLFQAVDAKGAPLPEFDELWTSVFPRGEGNHVHMLRKNHRQNQDPEFAEAIDKLATGTIANHRHLCALLRKCKNADEDTATHIYTHNDDVDRVNKEKLDKLPGEPIEFPVIHCEKLPAAVREKLKPLVLKIGCRVRCTRNTKEVANGHVGTVTDVKVFGAGSLVYVRFDHAPEKVIPLGYTDIPDLAPSEEDLQRCMRLHKEPTPTPKQIPLRLAYAMTVHSVQGLTLTGDVIVDLSRSFHPAMVVVAISRVCSRNNITVRGLIIDRPRDKPVSTLFYDHYCS